MSPYGYGARALSEINRMEEGKRHAEHSSLASPCLPVKHSHRSYSGGDTERRDKRKASALLWGECDFKSRMFMAGESREPDWLCSLVWRDGVFWMVYPLSLTATGTNPGRLEIMYVEEGR